MVQNVNKLRFLLLQNLPLLGSSGFEPKWGQVFRNKVTRSLLTEAPYSRQRARGNMGLQVIAKSSCKHQLGIPFETNVIKRSHEFFQTTSFGRFVTRDGAAGEFGGGSPSKIY